MLTHAPGWTGGGVPAAAGPAPGPGAHAHRPGAETDVLVGLGVGADDYLTKPFSVRAGRPGACAAAPGAAAPEQAGGDGRIVLASWRSIRRNGGSPGRHPGAPTPTEFTCCCTWRAAAHGAGPGGVAREVWAGRTSPARAHVDSHVKRATQLGADLIRTVHGVGTRWRCRDAALDRLATVATCSPPARPGALGQAQDRHLASGLRRAGLTYLARLPLATPDPDSLVTVAIVLLTAQVLGHGRPARCGHDRGGPGHGPRRLHAPGPGHSRDEVGQLAAAFNQWPPTWPRPTSSVAS